MKKPAHHIRNTLLWVLAILLGAGLLAWAFLPKPIPVETARVTRGPYDQLVIEEGKTRAKEIYQIASPVSGDLRRVELHAGDAVKKGDVLAVVDWPQPWEIRSPITGRILKVKRESGGPIEREEVIMEVADPALLEVVSEVLTEDAITIQPGAPVRIESYGACPPLEGKVRLVEPAAFTKVSALGVEEQRVNVIIDFTSPLNECPGLADGFRVNDYISTYHSDDALLVPTGALFRDRQDWTVFKVVDGRARRTPVTIPRRNPNVAMVEGGLKVGDEVIVYPGDDIKDGVRVEASF